jgi:inner membrane protein involved in colicin E2 resistance
METPEKYKTASVFESKTSKMIMVGFLILVLLVPLHFVKSLIEERIFGKKTWWTKLRKNGAKAFTFTVLF